MSESASLNKKSGLEIDGPYGSAGVGGGTGETKEQPAKMIDDNNKVVDVETPKFPTRLQYKPLSVWLGKRPTAMAIYGAVAGFFLYFSMYALRKPFKAAKYEDEGGNDIIWGNTGMSLKTALVLFQLVGYMSSKWIGIKVTSEAKGKQDIYLMATIIMAELSLVLFGLLGSVPDATPFAMFFNGLALGVVWGFVVLYFEGRGSSDFMLVALSVSFIVSSGIVKDVALAVLRWDINPYWMPAVVGAFFIPLYAAMVLALNQLPAPSEEEMLDKADRIVMTHKSRLSYFLKFWPGLICLWVGVMFLTAYRDYRDSFAVEIFDDMGFEVVPGTLGSTESIVAGVLLIPIAFLVFCKNNLRAFKLAMLALVVGAIILIISVSLFMASPYDGYNYYVITGVASYLAYVPYNSVLYERLIAVLHEECNIAYLMAVM